jgi:hypothetical protein
MIQSVDARFDFGKTFRDIQWLSNRESIYRALDSGHRMMSPLEYKKEIKQGVQLIGDQSSLEVNSAMYKKIIILILSLIVVVLGLKKYVVFLHYFRGELFINPQMNIYYNLFAFFSLAIAFLFAHKRGINLIQFTMDHLDIKKRYQAYFGVLFISFMAFISLKVLPITIISHLQKYTDNPSFVSCIRKVIHAEYDRDTNHRGPSFPHYKLKVLDFYDLNKQNQVPFIFPDYIKDTSFDELYIDIVFQRHGFGIDYIYTITIIENITHEVIMNSNKVCIN